MSDKNIKIMDELMQTIVQTEEWESIQENDPDIKLANKEMVSLLCEVKNHIPHALYLKIGDAIYSYSNAVSSAAMLYGMGIIEAIRDVSARPCDLSRHVMKRTGRAEV